MDHKEGWALKNWCFWIVELEKTLENPLNSKEIKPVNPKGNQPWIFISRTDAEAEVPVLWPSDAKSWLIGKTLMLGKIEGRRKSGWQRMRWLDDITDSMNMNLSKLWEIVKDRKTWFAAVHRVTKSQTWLSDWTTTNISNIFDNNIYIYIYIYMCVCVCVCVCVKFSWPLNNIGVNHVNLPIQGLFFQ